MSKRVARAERVARLQNLSADVPIANVAALSGRHRVQPRRRGRQQRRPWWRPEPGDRPPAAGPFEITTTFDCSRHLLPDADTSLAAALGAMFNGGLFAGKVPQLLGPRRAREKACPPPGRALGSSPSRPGLFLRMACPHASERMVVIW